LSALAAMPDSILSVEGALRGVFWLHYAFGRGGLERNGT
jgi:hypothetical protein